MLTSFEAVMTPALFGSLSAISLGTSDFLSRFSTRALGAPVVFFAVLSVGSLVLTLWILFFGVELVWRIDCAWLLLVNGIATLMMTILLYTSLARGPVSVVAPIVAAHPILVVLFWFTLGARPGLFQWLCIGGAIIGVILVACSRSNAVRGRPDQRAYFQLTVLMALVASFLYTLMVVAGQSAIPIYGEVQTVWLSRLIGLFLLTGFFVVRRKCPSVPFIWWPFLIAQGCLDMGGYLLLLAGSSGSGRQVAAVAASGFGVVTALLGRFVLKETVTVVQWTGVVLVFLGVGILSGQGY